MHFAFFLSDKLVHLAGEVLGSEREVGRLHDLTVDVLAELFLKLLLVLVEQDLVNFLGLELHQFAQVGGQLKELGRAVVDLHDDTVGDSVRVCLFFEFDSVAVVLVLLA